MSEIPREKAFVKNSFYIVDRFHQFCQISSIRYQTYMIIIRRQKAD